MTVDTETKKVDTYALKATLPAATDVKTILEVERYLNAQIDQVFRLDTVEDVQPRETKVYYDGSNLKGEIAVEVHAWGAAK